MSNRTPCRPKNLDGFSGLILARANGSIVLATSKRSDRVSPLAYPSLPSVVRPRVAVRESAAISCQPLSASVSGLDFFRLRIAPVRCLLALLGCMLVGYTGRRMDIDQIIAEIEWLERTYAVPDTRPLSPTDLSAANRRHDEMQANSPWFRLWQRYGVCCRSESPAIRLGDMES